MDALNENLAVLTDETGTIHRDVACRRCGYNLRGLHHEGRCPECGTAVGLSCFGDLLRFADPEWVATLARGAKLILWGTLASVLGAAFAVGIIATTGNRGPTTFIAFGGSLLSLFGVWLMTKADPSGIGEDRYVTERRIVRIALLIGLAEPILGYLRGTAALQFDFLLLLGMAMALIGLVGVIGEFAKLTYLAKLAQRIPNDALVRRFRLLRWFLVTGIAICAIVGSFAPVLRTAVPGKLSPPPWLLAVGCFVALAGLVAIIAGIVFLFLLNSLRKELREQARLGRQTWGAAGAFGAGPSSD